MSLKYGNNRMIGQTQDGYNLLTRTHLSFILSELNISVVDSQMITDMNSLLRL